MVHMYCRYGPLFLILLPPASSAGRPAEPEQVAHARSLSVRRRNVAAALPNVAGAAVSAAAGGQVLGTSDGSTVSPTAPDASYRAGKTERITQQGWQASIEALKC